MTNLLVARNLWPRQQALCIFKKIERKQFA
jgi:hypothetical protein